MAPIGHYLALFLMLTWAAIVLITRYSSLAAICTALLAPVFTWWIDDRFTIPVAMLSTLIVIRHRDNISRLLKGEEAKLSRKRRNKTS
jgi:glycerol-3-phosphate acyltransferase PlsY